MTGQTGARARARAWAARLVVVIVVVVGAAGPVGGLGASTQHSGGPLGVPGISGGPSAIGAIPNAGADPTVDVVDVPVDNPVGEFGGGFSVALPTDVATLRSRLERVRDTGILPERYATLTRQYWLAVSAENAGIDLNNWVPERGLAANLETVDRIYINYLRLGNSRDDYFWSGMAGRAGMSFAAGFWDLDEVGQLLTVPAVHELGTATGAALAGLPWEIAQNMPADVHLLATVGPMLTREDIDWYLHRLLVMQRHIFMDMAPIHEAYAAEGMPAVEELAAGGAYDDYVIDAWRMLDAGSPADLAEALVRMASREQNQIIADQWDAAAAGLGGAGPSDVERGEVGRVLTYITTIGASPDIPRVRSLGQFQPLTVRADVDGRPMTLHTPLPAFNWADREPRWEYIRQELVPRYRELVQERPAEAKRLLGVDFRDRTEQNRILRRLPAFLTEMTSGWALLPPT